MNANIANAFSIFAPPATCARMQPIVRANSNGFCFGYRMMPHSVAVKYAHQFGRFVDRWSPEWQEDWQHGFDARLEDIKDPK